MWILYYRWPYNSVTHTVVCFTPAVGCAWQSCSLTTASVSSTRLFWFAWATEHATTCSRLAGATTASYAGCGTLFLSYFQPHQHTSAAHQINVCRCALLRWFAADCSWDRIWFWGFPFPLKIWYQHVLEEFSTSQYGYGTKAVESVFLSRFTAANLPFRMDMKQNHTLWRHGPEDLCTCLQVSASFGWCQLLAIILAHGHMDGNVFPHKIHQENKHVIHQLWSECDTSVRVTWEDNYVNIVQLPCTWTTTVCHQWDEVLNNEIIIQHFFSISQKFDHLAFVLFIFQLGSGVSLFRGWR